MKKQTIIEKTALNFALQIFNLVESFPVEEKPLLGFELTREAVKISAGISTFIHLNEIKASFKFLNNAFSATFKGTLCTEGVYTYRVRFRDISSGRTQDFHGHVTLLQRVQHYSWNVNQLPSPLNNVWPWMYVK